MTTPDDLKHLADHELAYCVLMQLAVASAILANIFRDARTKPYKPEDFLIQLGPEKDKPSLRDAFQQVRDWAADLPQVVQRELNAIEKSFPA